MKSDQIFFLKKKPPQQISSDLSIPEIRGRNSHRDFTTFRNCMTPMTALLRQCVMTKGPDRPMSAQ